MIKIKNIIKIIFILLGILIIVIWFQIFHDKFFEQLKQNDVLGKVNQQTNNETNVNDSEKLLIGESLYKKISEFNFKYGDFDVDQGASEVLNIDELKILATDEFVQLILKENSIEPDDSGKYWDIGDRKASNNRYIDHHEMKLKKSNETNIDFIVIEYYVKNIDDLGKSYLELDSQQIKKIENQFSIVKENNVWKVSKYINPK